MFPFSFKSTFSSVDVNDLEELFGKINLIDVREQYEYRSGHLPTAKNIPMGELLNDPEKFLDKSKEYYIICQSGSRSSRTCSMLKNSGYNVINVSGGTGRYSGSLKR
ncbi:rhodanese-like domain-containing protein [Clostridium omnivorum]|uniref:Sulfurtransferase n=1 Tax=Clostridium omnivorum TaxID=1604902 RepID=A0ABQ5NC87_9CLOT|nr:rhodanese-like domain-containing protein [Clostridium sp. E14]GLC32786.1 sulfurtransferase [Clostridium sp. E14]